MNKQFLNKKWIAAFTVVSFLSSLIIPVPMPSAFAAAMPVDSSVSTDPAVGEKNADAPEEPDDTYIPPTPEAGVASTDPNDEFLFEPSEDFEDDSLSKESNENTGGRIMVRDIWQGFASNPEEAVAQAQESGIIPIGNLIPNNDPNHFIIETMEWPAARLGYDVQLDDMTGLYSIFTSSIRYNQDEQGNWMTNYTRSADSQTSFDVAAMPLYNETTGTAEPYTPRPYTGGDWYDMGDGDLAPCSENPGQCPGWTPNSEPSPEPSAYEPPSDPLVSDTAVPSVTLEITCGTGGLLGNYVACNVNGENILFEIDHSLSVSDQIAQGVETHKDRIPALQNISAEDIEAFAAFVPPLPFEPGTFGGDQGQEYRVTITIRGSSSSPTPSPSATSEPAVNESPIPTPSSSPAQQPGYYLCSSYSGGRFECAKVTDEEADQIKQRAEAYEDYLESLPQGVYGFGGPTFIDDPNQYGLNDEIDALLADDFTALVNISTDALDLTGVEPISQTLVAMNMEEAEEGTEPVNENNVQETGVQCVSIANSWGTPPVAVDCPGPSPNNFNMPADQVTNVNYVPIGTADQIVTGRMSQSNCPEGTVCMDAGTTIFWVIDSPVPSEPAAETPAADPQPEGTQGMNPGTEEQASIIDINGMSVDNGFKVFADSEGIGLTDDGNGTLSVSGPLLTGTLTYDPQRVITAGSLEITAEGEEQLSVIRNFLSGTEADVHTGGRIRFVSIQPAAEPQQPAETPEEQEQPSSIDAANLVPAFVISVATDHILEGSFNASIRREGSPSWGESFMLSSTLYGSMAAAAPANSIDEVTNPEELAMLASLGLAGERIYRRLEPSLTAQGIMDAPEKFTYFTNAEQEPAVPTPNPFETPDPVVNTSPNPDAQYVHHASVVLHYDGATITSISIPDEEDPNIAHTFQTSELDYKITSMGGCTKSYPKHNCWAEIDYNLLSSGTPEPAVNEPVTTASPSPSPLPSASAFDPVVSDTPTPNPFETPDPAVNESPIPTPSNSPEPSETEPGDIRSLLTGEVNYQTVYNGGFSNFGNLPDRNFVLNSREEAEAFWDEHRLGGGNEENLLPASFNSEDAWIGVSQFATYSAGHWKIEITGVEILNGELVVHVQETVPGLSMAFLDSVSAKIQIVKVEGLGEAIRNGLLPVRFDVTNASLPDDPEPVKNEEEAGEMPDSAEAAVVQALIARGIMSELSFIGDVVMDLDYFQTVCTNDEPSSGCSTPGTISFTNNGVAYTGNVTRGSGAAGASYMVSDVQEAPMTDEQKLRQAAVEAIGEDGATGITIGEATEQLYGDGGTEGGFNGTGGDPLNGGGDPSQPQPGFEPTRGRYLTIEEFFMAFNRMAQRVQAAGIQGLFANFHVAFGSVDQAIQLLKRLPQQSMEFAFGFAKAVVNGVATLVADIITSFQTHFVSMDSQTHWEHKDKAVKGHTHTNENMNSQLDDHEVGNYAEYLVNKDANGHGQILKYSAAEQARLAEREMISDLNRMMAWGQAENEEHPEIEEGHADDVVYGDGEIVIRTRDYRTTIYLDDNGQPTSAVRNYVDGRVEYYRIGNTYYEVARPHEQGEVLLACLGILSTANPGLGSCGSNNLAAVEEHWDRGTGFATRAGGTLGGFLVPEPANPIRPVEDPNSPSQWASITNGRAEFRMGGVAPSPEHPAAITGRVTANIEIGNGTSVSVVWGNNQEARMHLVPGSQNQFAADLDHALQGVNIVLIQVRDASGQIVTEQRVDVRWLEPAPSLPGGNPEGGFENNPGGNNGGEGVIQPPADPANPVRPVEDPNPPSQWAAITNGEAAFRVGGVVPSPENPATIGGSVAADVRLGSGTSVFVVWGNNPGVQMSLASGVQPDPQVAQRYKVDLRDNSLQGVRVVLIQVRDASGQIVTEQRVDVRWLDPAPATPNDPGQQPTRLPAAFCQVANGQYGCSAFNSGDPNQITMFTAAAAVREAHPGGDAHFSSIFPGNPVLGYNDRLSVVYLTNMPPANPVRPVEDPNPPADPWNPNGNLVIAGQGVIRIGGAAPLPGMGPNVRGEVTANIEPGVPAGGFAQVVFSNPDNPAMQEAFYLVPGNSSSFSAEIIPQAIPNANFWMNHASTAVIEVRDAAGIVVRRQDISLQISLLPSAPPVNSGGNSGAQPGANEGGFDNSGENGGEGTNQPPVNSGNPADPGNQDPPANQNPDPAGQNPNQHGQAGANLAWWAGLDITTSEGMRQAREHIVLLSNGELQELNNTLPADASVRSLIREELRRRNSQGAPAANPNLPGQQPVVNPVRPVNPGNGGIVPPVNNPVNNNPLPVIRPLPVNPVNPVEPVNNNIVNNPARPLTTHAEIMPVFLAANTVQARVEVLNSIANPQLILEMVNRQEMTMLDIQEIMSDPVLAMELAPEVRAILREAMHAEQMRLVARQQAEAAENAAQQAGELAGLDPNSQAARQLLGRQLQAQPLAVGEGEGGDSRG